MYQHQARKKSRQYLSIALVAAAASLLFSPPAFDFDQTAGAQTGQRPAITSTAQLTIAIAQNLDADSQVGLYAKDLKGSRTFGLGEDQTFDAASTEKVLFLAYVYHLAGAGQIDLDTIVHIGADEIQHYGTGSLQYQDGPLDLSYRKLAELMMRQSDNTAAYVLAQRLGEDNIQAYGQELGLTHNSVADNQTTPADMVKLLERIYRGQITSPALRAEMESDMTDSQFEDRLTPGLPPSATLYHKTGDALGGGIHDVGFVTYQGHAYAVALYTKSVNINKIPTISRDIFAYFAR